MANHMGQPNIYMKESKRVWGDANRMGEWPHTLQIE